jgi:hypothetical protein
MFRHCPWQLACRLCGKQRVHGLQIVCMRYSLFITCGTASFCGTGCWFWIVLVSSRDVQHRFYQCRLSIFRLILRATLWKTVSAGNCGHHRVVLLLYTRERNEVDAHNHHHHHHNRNNNNNNNHHLSFMADHLLTRSGLTCPEASSKVCHDSFCQSGSSVSLPWVIYYEASHLLWKYKFYNSRPNFIILCLLEYLIQNVYFLSSGRQVRILEEFLVLVLLIIWRLTSFYTEFNHLTPELNPSSQRCLMRFFTGDFASWTVYFVYICVKTQQMHQLFIQFINYVW